MIDDAIDDNESEDGDDHHESGDENDHDDHFIDNHNMILWMISSGWLLNW